MTPQQLSKGMGLADVESIGYMIGFLLWSGIIHMEEMIHPSTMKSNQYVHTMSQGDLLKPY